MAARRSDIRWWLFLAGVPGVLALALELPWAASPPEGGVAPHLLALAVLAQGLGLLALAVVVGERTGPGVGLDAPLLRQWVRGEAIRGWRSAGLWGLGGGALGACCLIGSGWLMPAEMRALADRGEVSLAVRLLYGGITEELLLRWGLMGLLAWLVWGKVLGRRGPLRGPWGLAPVVLSALVFAAGHLPAVAAMGMLSMPVVVHVLWVNALFGIVAGLLFWRRGLESAVLAHVAAHLVWAGWDAAVV